MMSSLLIIRCSLFRSPPCCGVIACRHVTSVAAASGEREREMAKGAAQPSVGRRGGKAPSDNTRALPIGEISDAWAGGGKLGATQSENRPSNRCAPAADLSLAELQVAGPARWPREPL